MSDIVVCCTDGSDVSVRAIRAGLALLDRERWRVRLVICVPEAAVELGTGGLAPSAAVGISAGAAFRPNHGHDLLAYQERLIDMGLSRVREVAATVGLGEEHLEVLVGRPAETVLDYLKDQDAKLVVLGTRGLGGAARLFLGSVSDHLLRKAPCPVLVGGEDLPEESAGPVVVCVDGSERSVQAGRAAVGLFSADLPVAVATVRPLPDRQLGQSALAEKDRQDRASEADRALDAAAAAMDRPDADRVLLDGDDATEALRAYATAHPVRCLVLASHGRGALRRAALGTVVERLVKSSPTLVCVVPRRP